MDLSESPPPKLLRRNAALLCVLHAVYMALFPMSVIALFLSGELGLSMLDVFVLQALFGLGVAVLELPSGYVADRIGYRPALLWGSVLGALGWGLYAAATSFASVLVAELLLAASVSLVSGTDSALLYESLKSTGEEATFTRWYSRMRALGNFTEGSAALVGSLLFASFARAPFAAQAAMWLLGVLVVLALVEPARERGAAMGATERVRSIVRFASVGSPQLRAVIVMFLALALPPYTMVWVLPSYVTQGGTGSAWLGAIWALASYTVALFAWLVPSLERRYGALPILATCVMLVGLAFFGMAAAPAAYGWLFYLALCMVRGLQAPILARQEQELIPSSDRAALLSIKNLGFRGAFVLIAPLVGAALDAYGMRPVLVVSGVVFVACASLAWLGLAARTAAQNESAPMLAYESSADSHSSAS